MELKLVLTFELFGHKNLTADNVKYLYRQGLI
jgi:hypothetical protein